MAASINVNRIECSVSSGESCRATLEQALLGTYMKLRVTSCPFRGGFEINVETDHPDVSEAELAGMLLMLMSDRLMKPYARKAS